MPFPETKSKDGLYCNLGWLLNLNGWVTLNLFL